MKLYLLDSVYTDVVLARYDCRTVQSGRIPSYRRRTPFIGNYYSWNSCQQGQLIVARFHPRGVGSRPNSSYVSASTG
jgi:hypothetical protein